MKIARYLARDMRDAIRQVREHQGPDAVVLSTRRLDTGLEIIAAIDYDDTLMRQAATAVSKGVETPVTKEVSGERPVDARPSAPAADKPGDAAPADRTADSSLLPVLGREIKSIRDLLQTQMAQLAWREFGQEYPARAGILRELTALGLTRDVALRLLQEVPLNLDRQRAARLSLGHLAKRLRAGETDLLETGGTIAIVGPTGVGKTTTIAKLAARYVMQCGSDGVALVTTDLLRIGGQEQLYHYSRLLGVPLFSAQDADELRKLLKRLRDRHMVLIDTAGMSHRDMRLNRQLAMLRQGGGQVRIHLALSTCQNTTVLDDVTRHFLGCRPDGAILTKVDEAAELGSALSVVLRHGLAVNYLTDGQRVPDDLRAVRAHHLVARMVDLARCRERPDDHLLAEQFGGAVHALG